MTSTASNLSIDSLNPEEFLKNMEEMYRKLSGLEVLKKWIKDNTEPGKKPMNVEDVAMIVIGALVHPDGLPERVGHVEIKCSTFIPSGTVLILPRLKSGFEEDSCLFKYGYAGIWNMGIITISKA